MAGSAVGTKVLHRPRGVVRTKVAITCDASGDATATVVGVGFGRLVAVGYTPGTLATGVDITVTDTATGKAILTLTDAGTSPRYFRPTQVVTGATGAALTAGDGSGGAGTGNDVNRDIFLAGKVSVVAAQGGNLGAGALHLIVDETGVGDLALI